MTIHLKRAWRLSHSFVFVVSLLYGGGAFAQDIPLASEKKQGAAGAASQLQVPANKIYPATDVDDAASRANINPMSCDEASLAGEKVASSNKSKTSKIQIVGYS